MTTEVVGNCGFGCFPLLDKELAPKAIYGHSSDVPLTWTTAAGYFERLEEAAPAINVASLAPNGQIRLSVVGLADRPARPTSCAKMRYLLDEALDQGAWGYSTGLEYAAERGADEDELVSMCKVCGTRHGLYATHTRGRDRAAGGIDEAVRTARALRCAAAGVAPHPAQRARIVTPLRRARRRCSRQRHGRGLRHAHAALRHDVPAHRAAAGGARGTGAAARAAADRERRRAMRELREHPQRGRRLESHRPARQRVWPEYARRDIASIAAERGQDPLDAVYDLLLGAATTRRSLMVINHAYTEEQQREAFCHPLCVPGSDATTMAPDGPLAGSVFHGAYTWAAWYLRFCAQQERVLTPARGSPPADGQPAERLGMTDRGVLRAGAAADVVVFDPIAFRGGGHDVRAEPGRNRDGHVVVNGVVTLRGGALTGSRSGAVLRR